MELIPTSNSRASKWEEGAFYKDAVCCLEGCGVRFRSLQARWEIVKNPCRQYDLGTITNIMMCCIILHNVIIKDEQSQDLEPILEQGISKKGMHRDLTFRELNVDT
jgi:hypothetical protein